MKKVFQKPLLVFVILSFVVGLALFLLPLRIFDGELVWESGLQKIVIQKNLSLSEAAGVGYDKAETPNIKDFYLTTKGYIIAVIMIFGVPGLFAYRMYLSTDKTGEEQK